MEPSVVREFPSAVAVLVKQRQAVFVLPASAKTQYLKVFSDPSKFNSELEIYQALDKSRAVPDIHLVNNLPSSLHGFLMEDAGESLLKLNNLPLSWSAKSFLTFTEGFLTSLLALHDHGWMHGDLNPGNVCWDGTFVQLIDFGLADKFGSISNGVRKGLRPKFFPPEFEVAGSVASPASDVFAAGKVLEWILNESKGITVVDDTSVIKQIIASMVLQNPGERKTLNDLITQISTILNTGSHRLSLAELSAKNFCKLVQKFPERYLDAWDRKIFSLPFPDIGYNTVHYMLENGNPPPEYDSIVKCDEYYSECELVYRQQFVDDPDSKKLEDPYLLLQNVFEGGRSLKSQPISPEEEEQLYFLFKDKIPASPTVMVPRKTDFLRNWNTITQGIFKFVNFSNVFIAGGAVLAALQPETDFETSAFFNADIDVFIYGLKLDQVEQKVRELYSAFKRALGDRDLLLIRNIRSLVIISEYPGRQIQIVFRLYRSPAEILMGFDIDSCCFGFDGDTVWALPRGLRAITRRYNVVNMTRRSASYEYRLFKYSRRGFAVAIPEEGFLQIGRETLNSVQEKFSQPLNKRSRYVDGNVHEADDSEVTGFAKLLTLSTRELLVEHVKQEDAESKWDNAEIIQADRKIERLEMRLEVDKRISHYQAIKIPRGPTWSVARIMNYLRNFIQSRIKMMYNYTEDMFNFVSSFKKKLKSRNVDDGVMESNENEDEEDEDDGWWSGPNVHPFVYAKNDIDLVLSADVAHFHHEEADPLSFIGSWVTENPGQQLLTGSFDPVQTTWKEWFADLKVDSEN
ncbi:Protein mono-ADP-ribosyltransferase parp4 [Nowakowskiella sp. JEL0407]|nr:Protein mono-ADP-ribosyltransferase parp4 [Nowakowskiella sp. JEL0407]